MTIKKWLKLGVITCVSVIMLLVGLLVAIVLLIDPNDFKTQITAQVEKQLHRQLVIDGDLSWQVWPPIGIAFGQTTLYNSQEFDATQPLASFAEARVNVDILPLLHGQFVVNELRLEQFLFHLTRNQDGISNIDDLMAQSATADSEPATQQQDEAEGTTDPSEGFELKDLRFQQGVQLVDATIIVEDQAQHSVQKVERLNLSIGGFALDEWFPVEMSVNVTAENPQLSASLSLKSNVLLTEQLQRVQLRDTEFKAAVEGDALPVPLQTTLKFATDIQIAQQQFELSQFELMLQQQQSKLVPVSNDLSLSLQAQGNWAQQQYQVTGLQLKNQLAGATAKPIQIQLDTAADIDLQQQTLTLPTLQLDINQLKAQFPLQVQNLLTTPVLQGQLSLSPIHLKQWLASLGVPLPEMSDNALQNLTLQANIQQQSNAVNVDNIKMQLDQATLTGKVSLQFADILQSRFALKMDRLNLDQYLPPNDASQTGASSEGGETEKGAEAVEPDLSFLRQFDVKGTLDVAQLTVKGIDTRDNHIGLSIQKGILSLNPLSLKLFQGSMNNVITVNAQQKKAALSLHSQISQVQFGPLLQAVAESDLISGALTSDIHLNTVGLSPKSMQQYLSGKGNFSFENGAVTGINIPAMLRKAKAALSGQTAATTSEPVKTDFTRLAGAFNASQGVINNTTLTAMSPLLRIEGKGIANLPKQGIDYLLNVAVVDTLKGQDGKPLDELKGITVPLAISGDLLSPKIGLDYKSAVANKVKQQVKQKEDELKQKAEQKAKDELDKVLKDKIKFF